MICPYCTHKQPDNSTRCMTCGNYFTKNNFNYLPQDNILFSNTPSSSISSYNDSLSISYKSSLALLILNLIIDVFLMLIIIGIFMFISHLLQYFTNLITLDERGVVIKKGILSISTTQIPYKKINSISINKGLLGRLLGFGDICISTGNDTVEISFESVQNPEEIKRIIENYLV